MYVFYLRTSLFNKMNEQLYKDLDKKLIEKFETFIANNKENNCGCMLSNSQVPISYKNLQTIKTIKEPCYIYAGDTAYGYNYMVYYRHTNGNIYIVNSYIQEFDSYYTLEEWEKTLNLCKSAIDKQE